MKSPQIQKEVRAQKLLNYHGIMQAADVEYDPLFALYADLGATLLPSGDKALAIGSTICMGRAIRNLLSGPSPNALPDISPNEGILIGREVTTGKPVGILYEEATRGIYLGGTTGSGKTNLQALIASQLPPNVTYIGVDSKNEIIRFRNVCKGKFLYIRPNERYVNILEPIGPDPVASWSSRLEKIAPILKIDDQTWPELVQLLNAIYKGLPPGAPMISLAEFAAFLSEWGKRKKKSKFCTASSRLMILVNVCGDASRTKAGPNPYKRYQFIGVDYSGCSHQIRHALEAATLDMLMQTVAVEGHSSDLLRYVYAADEGLDDFAAQYSPNAKSGRISYQQTATAQGRSFGLARTISFQFHTQGDTSVVSNSGCLIITKTPDPRQARIALHMLGLGDEFQNDIQSMPVGYAYLRSPTYPNAIKIHIPLVPLADYPSASEMRSMMEPEIRYMRQNSILAPEQKYNLEPIDYREILGYEIESEEPASASVDDEDEEVPTLLADWILLLEEIVKNPNSYVVRHYRALSWSAYRGNKVKKELIQEGLIQSERDKSESGRPRVILKITCKGLRALEGLKNETRQ